MQQTEVIIVSRSRTLADFTSLPTFVVKGLRLSEVMMHTQATSERGWFVADNDNCQVQKFAPKGVCYSAQKERSVSFVSMPPAVLPTYVHR